MNEWMNERLNKWINESVDQSTTGLQEPQELAYINTYGSTKGKNMQLITTALSSVECK